MISRGPNTQLLSCERLKNGGPRRHRNPIVQTRPRAWKGAFGSPISARSSQVFWRFGHGDVITAAHLEQLRELNSEFWTARIDKLLNLECLKEPEKRWSSESAQRGMVERVGHALLHGQPDITGLEFRPIHQLQEMSPVR